MSEEASIEHFHGAVDAPDVNERHAFLQAAQIVAGEAQHAHGRFTFAGYAVDGDPPVLETAGRYVRDGNIIRVFFDTPAAHAEDVILPHFPQDRPS